MYHIHVSFSNKTKLTYLYLFEYSETTKNHGFENAIIKKSLFKFGAPKVYFAPPGDTIAISEKELHSENVNDLIKSIIVAFFELEFEGIIR